MKRRLTGYTFDASAKTVVHADFSDVTLAGIQLITNVTDNIIIYNFADATKGGTLSTDTLTLTYDTTSMSDTDELMILVDDAVVAQTISGTVTANLSATDNQVLDDIKVDTEAIETAVEAIQAAQLPDGHNVTVDNSTGAAAVNIQDGGNSITVDGTVTANLSATDNAVLDQIELNTDPLLVVGSGTEATAQRVTIATDSTGVLSVDDNGSTLSVDDGGGAITVDASNLDIRDLTNTDVVTAELSAVDNAVLDAIAAATAAIETAVEGTLTVTGGGGGTEYTEDVATANPIVGKAIMVERDDVLSTVTPIEGDNIGLRGTAEGALWTQDFNSDAVLADTTAIKTATEATQAALETAGGLVVNLGANNDVTVSGVSTAANQSTIIGHLDGVEGLLTTIDTDTGNIDTSLNAIEAGYATEGSALGSGVLLQGDDGTDRTNVLVDTSGHLQVDILTAPTTTVQATDLDIRDLTATDVVTANLSATDNAVLDSIDTSTQGILADTAAIQTAVETIDNAISGSEMQVDVVAALPAGTNALGKVLPPDTDVTTHTNYAKKYYTSTGAATDGIIWSPAAGKRWHVVSMFINVSAAATVTLEDDKSGGDEAVMKMELAANSGTVINFSEMYPFASGEDAADLTVTTTAGNVYITCTGYEI